MIGQKFGMLLVVKSVDADAKRNLRWLCRCDCGGDFIAYGYKLRSGASQNCRCRQRAKLAAKNFSHGMTGSRLYSVWANMHARCGNPKYKQYADYGGRGITVCCDWRAFEPFAEWAQAHGYAEHLTIERKDNSAGYSPTNCRWATSLEQSRNKRPRKDQKLSDAQISQIRVDPRAQYAIAAEYGIQQQHVSRIKSGKRRAFPTEKQP